MSDFNYQFRNQLHHFNKGGRLLVLMSIYLHKNIRYRSWPSYETIMQETGLSRPSVADSIKWLKAVGALVAVPYRKRLGDEQKLAPRKAVYQITGILEIEGKTVPYLYLSEESLAEIEQEVRDIFNSSIGELSIVQEMNVNDVDSKYVQKTPRSKYKKDSAPQNGARKTSEPKPRNLLFDSVAKHVFEIESDDELKAMNEAQGVGSRIMNIVQWLKGEKDTFKINGSGKAKSLGFISRAAEPEHVHMFVLAYKKKYNAAPPRDIEKFIEHWRAWASTLMKSTQPANQTYHVARRGAGRAAATGAERDALLKELKGAK